MNMVHLNGHYFPKIVLNIFGISFTDTLLSAILLTFMFLIFFVVLTYKLDLKTNKGFIAISMYEIPKFIGNLAMGPKSEQHLTFLATLLFYIFVANILPFFPIPFLLIKGGNVVLTEFKAPTLDLNATLALGFAAVAYINYHAVKSKGLKRYFLSYFEPLIFLFPLHIIEEIARPFSLSVRLFGNIFSGAIIMSLVYDYIPFLASAFHIYFDIFAGGIQSLVFVSLTCVYMSFAVD